MSDAMSFLPYPDLAALLRACGESGEAAAEIIYSHPKEPEARLFSAFPAEGELTLVLRIVSTLAPGSVKLYLFDDHSGTTRTLDGEICFSDREEMGNSYSHDSFVFSLSPAQITGDKDKREGLFYYHFTVQTVYGEISVSQNEWEGGCLLNAGKEELSRFQLLFYRPDFHTPAGLKGGIMYQIFVDRFRRGGSPPVREGARLCGDWDGGIPEYPEKNGDPLANDLFFGGTLDGIREKLDELLLLHVNCLYLTPIFEARSNHKYDTGDYEKVDEMFGGDEALQRLLTAAKERGITVILDGVFNHTGDDSRYFNRYGRYSSVGACQSKESPYYRWYRFYDYPKEYECWWGVKILPRVKSNDPTFIRYLCGEGGVLQKYLRMGVGGFRLDVADELEEELLLAIRDRVKKEDPEAVIYGEVWEDASNKISYGKRRRYLRGEMLDGVMNYPLKSALIEYLLRGDAAFLSFTLRTLYSHYPKEASDGAMNLLGTHDTERILTVLAGAPYAGQPNAVLAEKGYMTEEEKTPHLPKLMLAYAMLCFLPGIPCIYYGDEAGMDGYHDPFNRRPYPWGRELKQLLAFYRQIGQLRVKEPLLKEGYYRELCHSGAGFAFERFDGRRRLLFLSNSGEAPLRFSLREPVKAVFSSPGLPPFPPFFREEITLPPVSFFVLSPTDDEALDFPATPDKD